MSTFNDNLLWRYATKKYDPTKKVSDADLKDLLESLRLAASSYGLESWKFIVVTNPELRAKLKEAAWNQSQITDASHLIVLCAHIDMDADYIRKFVAFTAKERGVPAESMKQYEDMMIGSIMKMSKDELSVWLQKQVYIALGFALTAAANKHIDATPMEGFDKGKFDEILDLKKNNLQSVVLCPIGYRAADDYLAPLKKVRFPMEEVVEFRD